MTLSLFDWPHAAGPPALRPYQRDVLERARAQLRRGRRRGVIQGDTGSGKTFVAAELVRLAHAKGTRVLVLAHRRRLVDQLTETLTRFGLRCGTIMEGRPRQPSPIQVACLGTALAILEAGGSLPAAELVVVDECHHTVSPAYQRVLACYPQSFEIGLTATPCRANGCGLGGPRGDGPAYEFLECTVPTSQLVAEGWLVPVTAYDPEGVGLRRQRGERTDVVGHPVAHWQRYAAGRPTVAFAPTVAESLAVRDAYRAAGIAAEHVDGQTPEAARDAAIARLESGQTQVICNVGVWTEGVDVPCLSCCQILRSCRSFVLYKQAVGRVMRPHPGKAEAVLLDHAGAVHEFGLPHADTAWSLRPDDSAGAAARKANSEGRAPLTCPQCALVFTGRRDCPGCGWLVPPPARRRPSAPADAGLLTRFAAGEDCPAARSAWQRAWGVCLRVAAAKGWAVRRAAGMFRGQTGHPPWECGVSPIPAAGSADWSAAVAELYPQLVRRRVAAR